MKRSRTIQLLLLGTVAGSALSGCHADSDFRHELVSADTTYTNNHHLPGAGYYHAPYHGFYPRPYNTYVAGRGYFHGGQWTDQPSEADLQASRPFVQQAKLAQARQQVAHEANSNIRRGGFGSSSRTAVT